MSADLVLILLAVAGILTGLVAGISLDKCVVQLPARHRIGLRDFAAFARANDLGNGLVLYPVLGVGAAAVTIAAACLSISPRLTASAAWPVYISAMLAVLHSVATTRSAQNILMLRQPRTDEARMAAAFDRFAAWHAARTVLQLMNFLTLLWALIAYSQSI